jgi:cyanate permease
MGAFWLITGIVTAGAGIALLQLPALIQEKRKREAWVFSILLTVALGLGIAHSLRIPIPNPHDWMTLLYKPASDVIWSWFE